MRRPGVLRGGIIAAVCAVAVVASGCGPEPVVTAPSTDRPTTSASATPSRKPTPARWTPVKDPDTSVWFAMPESPLRQRSDRVTTSGAHLLANQYHALYRAGTYFEPVAVIVTPYRVEGGSPTDARTVFQGMKDSLVSNGAHRARLLRIRDGSIDGRPALFATMRFTTKDRKADGYWRLAQFTGTDFAVLLQVQVSGPFLTRDLIRSGDKVMKELVRTLRLP